MTVLVNITVMEGCVDDEEDVSVHRPLNSDALGGPEKEIRSIGFHPTFSTWFVVLCGTINFGLAVGIPISLSVMFVDWQEAFQVSRARTAAVHATCVGILFAGGVIAGCLVNRFGARLTLLLGSFLASCGLFLATFATSIDYLIFTIGVVAGSGFCLIQLPCIPCITRVVTRYTSLAIAMCSLGGSGFGLILPYLFRELVHHFGWRGVYFVISGLALNTCVTSLILTSSASSSMSLHTTTIPLIEVTNEENSSPEKKNEADMTAKDPQKVKRSSSENLSQVPKDDGANSDLSYLVRESDISCVSDLPGQKTSDRKLVPMSMHPDTSDNLHPPDIIHSNEVNSEETACTHECSLLPPEVNGSHIGNTEKITSKPKLGVQFLQNLRTSKKWMFMADPLFIFCLFFLGLTLGPLFTFGLLLMDFAKTKGYEDNESVGVLLILVTVLASTAGRIVAGLLNLIPIIHSFHILCFSGMLGSVAMIILANLTTQHAGILFCLAVIGVGHGGIIGIYPKSILDLDTITTESYPIAFGIACSFEGVFDVVIPIVAGHLVDVTGSYFTPLLILGCTAQVFSVTLAIVFFVTHRRKQAKHE